MDTHRIMDDGKKSDPYPGGARKPGASPCGEPAAAEGQGGEIQTILDLVGEVCHDLTQPMQVASGYADLLLLRTPHDSPAHDILKKIREQMGRMAEINQRLNAIIRSRVHKQREGP